MIVHLIGPGGAGKTTTAQLISKKFAIQYYDLDEIFMIQEGSISAYIDSFSYRSYAIRNLEIYTQLLQSLDHRKTNLIVCSSGFMCYPSDIIENYFMIKKLIVNHPLTFLLLPSFDLEDCVKEILNRQMQRSYLNISIEKEEQKIRKRFPIYASLKCKTILTYQDKNVIAFQIYRQIIQDQLFKKFL